MIEIKAYQCSFCKKYGKSKSNIMKHEKGCYHNPVTKACATCGAFYQKQYEIPQDVYPFAGTGFIPKCKAGFEISSLIDNEKKVNLKNHCQRWVSQDSDFNQVVPFINLSEASKQEVSDFTRLSLKSMNKKELDRLKRVIRLSSLINGYYHYSMAVLHGSLSSKDDSYEEAVKTSELINSFFEDKSKPDDFLHKKDDEANKAIDEYEKYCLYLETGVITGLSKRSIEAFCKHVEYSYDIMGLKSTFLLHNKLYMDNVYAYAFKMTTWEQLKNGFVYYSLPTKETKKIDSATFRRTINQIESLYNKIHNKQEERSRTRAMKLHISDRV